MEDARTTIRRTLAQVKVLLAQEAPPKLTEADTKANFIEPIVAALGWTGIGVVTREFYVKNSQEFIDYVMAGPGGKLLAIEAKPLQTDLTDKSAAQLIQYCAVEGVEWAALTNGRELQFFNTFLKPDLAAKRVLSLDLLAFNSDEEFDALFAQVWQLSRVSMTTPTGVRTWLNQRRLDAALRTILLNPGSPTLRYLRKALADADVTASQHDLAQWFRSHLASPIAALPIPPRRESEARVHTLSAGTPPADVSRSDLPGRGPDASFDPRNAAIFASSRRAQFPVFEALRRTMDGRWPDSTTWRSRKHYIAAEAGGQTFLAIKASGGRLIVGLTLPPETADPRLRDAAGEFNWARMTKVAQAGDTADVDDGLLDLIAIARDHAIEHASGSRYVGVSLRNLVDAGLLPPNTPLVLVARGNRDVARASLSQAGKIVWEGRAYGSPSDRAFAAPLGVTAFNGWSYWHAELPHGRVRLAGVRAQFNAVESGPDAEAAG